METAKTACGKFARHFSLFSESSGFGKRLCKFLGSKRIQKLIGEDESSMLVESLDGFAARNRALYSSTNKGVAQWLAKSDFRRNRAPKERRFTPKPYFPYVP